MVRFYRTLTELFPNRTGPSAGRRLALTNLVVSRLFPVSTRKSPSAPFSFSLSGFGVLLVFRRRHLFRCTACALATAICRRGHGSSSVAAPRQGGISLEGQGGPVSARCSAVRLGCRSDGKRRDDR